MVIDAGGVEVVGDRVARSRHGVGAGGAALVLPRRHRRASDRAAGSSLSRGLRRRRHRARAFVQLESFAAGDAAPLDAERGIERWGTTSSSRRSADASMSSRSATRRPTASTCRCSSSAEVTSRRRPTTPCLLTGLRRLLDRDDACVLARSRSRSPRTAVCSRSPCIRGGAEEGEDWHRAGMREHKQQVFDDFHAAADWLVRAGSRRDDGSRSAAGRTAGCWWARRSRSGPISRRASPLRGPAPRHGALPPLLIARLWTPEYGDPDVAEELEWVLAYSPITTSCPARATPRCCSPRPRATDASTQPRPQDDRAAAVGDLVRRRAPDPAAAGGSSRPRRGQAAREAGRRARRRAAFLWWQLGADLYRIGMTGSPTIAELVVGGDPERSARRRVHGRTGTTSRRRHRLDPHRRRPRRLPGVGSLVAPGAPAVDDRWPATRPRTMSYPTARPPEPVVAIDHLVVLTPDLDRTIDARSPSKGSSCAGPRRSGRRRTRGEAGVLPPGRGDPRGRCHGRGGDEPAQFWGSRSLSDDLDATLRGSRIRRSARRGPPCNPDAASPRSASPAGLGVPVALMDR